MATLKDLFNKVKNVGLFNRISNDTQAVSPQLTPIQLDEYGDVDPFASATLGVGIKQKVTPRTWNEKLFGRNMDYDWQSIDPDGNAQLQTIQSFRPGLFNNIGSAYQNMRSGFNENLSTPFDISNLQETNAGNGNPKGLGYRFGEALGTTARLFDSPLGRMALTAGLVGLGGGSGLEALAYGGQAGLINQNNRMKNNLYRDELQRQRIDTSNIGGYIGDDTFKQVLAAKTLQDNAQYRNAMLASMDANRRDTLALRQQDAEYRRQQDAINNAMGWSRIALDKQKLAATLAAAAEKGTKLTNAQQSALSNIAQMDTILELIDENPNATGIWQGLNPTQNKLDSYSGQQGLQNVQTRAAIDKLRTEIRHALTGAQFSPKEAKEYEKFLPTNRDNPNEIRAKITGLKQMFMADPRLLGNLEAEYNANASNNFNVDNEAIDAELRKRGAL